MKDVKVTHEWPHHFKRGFLINFSMLVGDYSSTLLHSKPTKHKDGLSSIDATLLMLIVIKKHSANGSLMCF